jgi:hypothetical protein
MELTLRFADPPSGRCQIFHLDRTTPRTIIRAQRALSTPSRKPVRSKLFEDMELLKLRRSL